MVADVFVVLVVELEHDRRTIAGGSTAAGTLFWATTGRNGTAHTLRFEGGDARAPGAPEAGMSKNKGRSRGDRLFSFQTPYRL